MSDKYEIYMKAILEWSDRGIIGRESAIKYIDEILKRLVDIEFPAIVSTPQQVRDGNIFSDININLKQDIQLENRLIRQDTNIFGDTLGSNIIVGAGNSLNSTENNVTMERQMTKSDAPCTSGARSVSAGGNITRSNVVTGDNNQVRLDYASLPQPASVDIVQVLSALRPLLEGVQSPDRLKITNALDEADFEVAKPAPDKAEVATALTRALRYFKGAAEFAGAAEKVGELAKQAAGWVGEGHAHALLAAIGLA